MAHRPVGVPEDVVDTLAELVENGIVLDGEVGVGAVRDEIMDADNHPKVVSGLQAVARSVEQLLEDVKNAEREEHL